MAAAAVLAGGCGIDTTADPGPPLPAAGPLSVVYDLNPIVEHLHEGTDEVPGMRAVERTARQYPAGFYFPRERWLGKVHRSQLAGRSGDEMARILRTAMDEHRNGRENHSRFVAIDEIGLRFEDRYNGPALLRAMRILSRSRDPETGDPLNRRVLMYAAPKMVANVGSGNNRGQWDAGLAAARLSGGVYMQMYHADQGGVTGPFSAREWRTYLPVWRREMGGEFRRLRAILSNGQGVDQDTQWRWARRTPAGRAVLRNGVAAYRLETRAEATDWLRNWNRHSHGPGG